MKLLIMTLSIRNLKSKRDFEDSAGEAAGRLLIPMGYTRFREHYHDYTGTHSLISRVEHRYDCGAPLFNVANIDEKTGCPDLAQIHVLKQLWIALFITQSG